MHLLTLGFESAWRSVWGNKIKKIILVPGQGDKLWEQAGGRGHCCYMVCLVDVHTPNHSHGPHNSQRCINKNRSKPTTPQRELSPERATQDIYHIFKPHAREATAPMSSPLRWRDTSQDPISSLLLCKLGRHLQILPARQNPKKGNTPDRKFWAWGCYLREVLILTVCKSSCFAAPFTSAGLAWRFQCCLLFKKQREEMLYLSIQSAVKLWY